jgi:hypothetical protein
MRTMPTSCKFPALSVFLVMMPEWYRCTTSRHDSSNPLIFCITPVNAAPSSSSSSSFWRRGSSGLSTGLSLLVSLHLLRGVLQEMLRGNHVARTSPGRHRYRRNGFVSPAVLAVARKSTAAAAWLRRGGGSSGQRTSSCTPRLLVAGPTGGTLQLRSASTISKPLRARCCGWPDPLRAVCVGRGAAGGACVPRTGRHSRASGHALPSVRLPSAVSHGSCSGLPVRSVCALQAAVMGCDPWNPMRISKAATVRHSHSQIGLLHAPCRRVRA